MRLRCFFSETLSPVFPPMLLLRSCPAERPIHLKINAIRIKQSAYVFRACSRSPVFGNPWFQRATTIEAILLPMPDAHPLHRIQASGEHNYV